MLPQDQNPAPQTPPSNNGQYDFFLNPQAPPKRPLFSLGGGSMQKRLLIIGGGLVVLIILIVAASSLSKGSSNTPVLLAVAQDQQELIRVASEASNQATQQTSKNLAASVQWSLTSEQQLLLNYMSTNGMKVSPKQLAATKNTSTDQQLSAATAASNFDPVFASVMQKQIQNYGSDLNAAVKVVGPKGKALLNQDLVGAKVLFNQTNTLVSSLQS